MFMLLEVLHTDGFSHFQSYVNVKMMRNIGLAAQAELSTYTLKVMSPSLFMAGLWHSIRY